MSTTEHAYERLVAANPMPDPEQYASEIDLDAVLRHFEEVIMDTEIRQVDTAERAQARAPRWAIAAAAFVAVLTVGLAMVLLMPADDAELVSDDPSTAVVESFFNEWNAGDAEAALALVHPEATVNLGVRIFGGWIAWTIPFEGRMEVTCAPGSAEGTVTCDWAWITAGTEAFGLADATEHTFTIEEGRITRMTVRNYGAFEGPMTRFAQAEDPDGYADACGADGTSTMGIAGYALNERCGAFVAQHEAAFVASLSG